MCLSYFPFDHIASGVCKLALKARGGMHIGNLIREKLEEKQRTVVWLAHELSYSRTNVYKIFAKSSIDTHVLMRISQILRYDFFRDYSHELDEECRE